MIFTQALSRVLENEGGYVNDPSDHGGATKYGITEHVARAHGYGGEMKDLPIDTAAAIYKANYWDAPDISSLEPINNDVAVRVFDFGVNAGPETSIELLQTTLNALTGKVQAVDGKIGPATIAALKSVSTSKDSDLALNTLRSFQVQHYVKIAEANESQHKFLKGWILRVFR